MLIGEGPSNHAISQRLSITIGTVKRHNTHIFTRLGASSRTDAVRRIRTLSDFSEPGHDDSARAPLAR
jgi:DNA-binding NarL/FixJ family response regulator